MLAIVLACIAAAVGYGIVHDQVTARVCVEYFTIGHPRILDTSDPTVLGLAWGVLATWWVGLLLGVALALAARAGSRPKRELASLIRPIAWLLVIMAVGAAASGLIGWQMARHGMILLPQPLASRVPAERHVAFLADAFAHSASYTIGALGGLVLVGLVWKSRRSAVAVVERSSEPNA